MRREPLIKRLGKGDSRKKIALVDTGCSFQILHVPAPNEPLEQVNVHFRVVCDQPHGFGAAADRDGTVAHLGRDLSDCGKRLP